MRRVTRPGGTVAAYVWDYAEGMQPIRCFWDAARERDPGAAELDEAGRFPLCQPGPLAVLFGAAGLVDVETAALTVPTRFASFSDYWTPFLGGQGPAPAYVMSLGADQRDALRDTLAARLPVGADGGIELSARAWAVRGTVAGRRPYLGMSAMRACVPDRARALGPVCRVPGTRRRKIGRHSR